MKRTIEILITPDGQSRVETKGFAGPNCREASRFVEEALGTKTAEQLTPEYHASSIADHVRQDQGGPAD